MLAINLKDSLSRFNRGVISKSQSDPNICFDAKSEYRTRKQHYLIHNKKTIPYCCHFESQIKNCINFEAINNFSC